MAQCAECGTKLPAKAQHCPGCGSPVGTAAGDRGKRAQQTCSGCKVEGFEQDPRDPRPGQLMPLWTRYEDGHRTLAWYCLACRPLMTDLQRLVHRRIDLARKGSPEPWAQVIRASIGKMSAEDRRDVHDFLRRTIQSMRTLPYGKEAMVSQLDLAPPNEQWFAENKARIP